MSPVSAPGAQDQITAVEKQQWLPRLFGWAGTEAEQMVLSTNRQRMTEFFHLRTESWTLRPNSANLKALLGNHYALNLGPLGGTSALYLQGPPAPLVLKGFCTALQSYVA